jgi:hypothetical protein
MNPTGKTATEFAAPRPAEEQEATLRRFEAAEDAPESLRERVAEALLIAILGTDDRDFLTGCDLPADEIARLIVEHGADAAIAAMTTPVEP